MTKTQAALKMVEKGMTYGQIAEALNTTRNSVAGLIWRSEPENNVKYRQYQRGYMRTYRELPASGPGSLQWWKARGF